MSGSSSEYYYCYDRTHYRYASGEPWPRAGDLAACPDRRRARIPPPALVTHGSAVRVEALWEGTDRFTLVIHAPSNEVGRLIRKGGVIVDQILGPLARRTGARLGLRVGVEVLEA